jgi:tetratricopeptide (TPR) repeat protein
MTDLTADHYETLGVGRDASPSVVKTAYLRLIQVHTPEKSPDQFRLISEAYRTLSNPDRRKQYDSEERLPPQLQGILNTIMREAESDPGSAAEELLALGSKHSQFPSIRRLAAVLFHHNEEYDVAIDILQDLAAEDPTSSDLAAWLGASLLGDGRTTEGVASLKEALVLDPNNTNAYLALAHHYMEQNQDQSALAVLDRGVHADGKVDVADLPLFIAMLLPLARQEKWPELRTHAKRLADLVPESDPEARRYVASQLYPALLLFDGSGRPDLSKYVLDLILRLDPTNAEIRGLVETLTPAADLWRERSELFSNPSAPEWVKALVAALTTEEGKPHSDTVVQNLVVQAAENLTEMQNDWQRFRQTSPKLSADLQDAWNSISSSAKELRRRFALAGSSPRTPAAEPSGCLALLLIPLLLTGASLVLGALL